MTATSASAIDRQRLLYIRLQMLRRCYDPGCKHFKNYGARGIDVCERWRSSPSAFVDDVSPRPLAE